jgi:hypothetical protein
MWRSGSKAFRLAFDEFVNPPVSDWFELGRELQPKAGATIHFHTCRGYMTPASVLRVETSQDGGRSWQLAGSVAGNANRAPDLQVQGMEYVDAWTARSAPLPVSAQPVRVRFRLAWEPGAEGYYTLQGQTAQVPAQGIFIDDISVSNCDWLEPRAATELGAGERHFTLTAASAGTALSAGKRLLLRQQTRLGGRWLRYGPLKEVQVAAVPLAGYSGWAAYQWPGLGGAFAADDDGDGWPNGLECAFGTDPLRGPAGAADAIERAGDKLALARPLATLVADLTYGAEASDDMQAWWETGVTLRHEAGVLRAEVDAGSGPRFLRWKISER